MDIVRKIAESIKHGLAKNKRVSQKTQRAILAKNSRECSTPRLPVLKKLAGHVAYQFRSSDGQLDQIEVKERQTYRTEAEERPLK